jgi:hypothetical protein
VTAPRACAYARVSKTLRDHGPAKLLASEQALTRMAADTLVFCADQADVPAARAACADIDGLREDLVTSGRWTPERADELVEDLWPCGPGFARALAVTA